MMSTTKEWLSDPCFQNLCDYVAKGDLICLTGAGISKGLKLKNNDLAPEWGSLLSRIKNSVEDDLTDSERIDLNELLTADAPGDNLIEAASILQAKNKDVFLNTLADSVDLMSGETSQTHKKLLDLSPRGILTYNYDIAHENAISQSVNSEDWQTVLPSEGDKIIDILKHNLNKRFLLKMHGSVEKKSSMVLTRESYRELFIQYPFYKAFMQQIFTNYHLLIVGFGMTDPDFEMLLQNVFSTFGSPVQEHIVIKHISSKTSKDTVYRLRYGLHYLYVNDFADIPEILSDCTHTPGSILEDILKKSVSRKLEERGKAHSNARELCSIGKRCLANQLEELIRMNISKESDNDYALDFETSEYVYTYGVIVSSTKDQSYKNFLIKEVVEKSLYAEPVAHALVHLRDVLGKDDMSSVEQWIDRFKMPYFKGASSESHEKVSKYCESILYLLRAKYETE